jgi:hypothetical protein
MLAFVSKFGGGGDKCILWLGFVRQNEEWVLVTISVTNLSDNASIFHTQVGSLLASKKVIK